MDKEKMNRVQNIREFSIDDPRIYEKDSDKPALTIPDQSMTIHEILALYQRGEATEGKNPSFEVNENVTDSDAFDVYGTEDNPDELTRMEDEMNELKERKENERKEIIRGKRQKPIEENSGGRESNNSNMAETENEN